MNTNLDILLKYSFYFFRTLLAILHLLTIELVLVTPQKNVQKKMALHQGIVQMGMEFVV